MPTLNDVQSWLKSHEGQYMDYDGYAGVQCYDLLNFYTKQFWNFATWYFDPAEFFRKLQLPAGWSRLAGIQTNQIQGGDILIWGVPNSEIIGVPGHIAVAYDNQYGYDENGAGNNNPVTRRSISQLMQYALHPFIGVIRPNVAGGGNKPTPQPLTPEQSFVKKCQEMGYAPNVIYGIMGSIYGESGFNPQIAEGGEVMPFKEVMSRNWQGGWGLIQWTPGTKISKYPEWNRLNTAEVQADVMDDGFSQTRHQWLTDYAGTTEAVFNQYRTESGWPVDWAWMWNNMGDWNGFVKNKSISIETALAYFVIFCERPWFPGAISSWQKRLDKAKEYSKQDWSNLGDFNDPSGNPSGPPIEDDEEALNDPTHLMLLLQNERGLY